VNSTGVTWSAIADSDHRQLVAEVDRLIRPWLSAGEAWGDEGDRRPALDQLMSALLRVCGMRRLRLELTFDGGTYTLAEHGRAVTEDYRLEEAALRLLHRELQEMTREDRPGGSRFHQPSPVLALTGSSRRLR